MRAAAAVAPRATPRFDPGTLMFATMGATAIGGGLSAASTIAGGNYAKRAGQVQEAIDNWQADQLQENASTAIGAAQRRMLDTQEKTRLAVSTSVARSAAGGVNVAVGSPTVNVGQLAQKGEYHALMDLWQGQNEATGMENQAIGLRYSGSQARIGGEMQKDAADLSAAGTIASTAGSMAKIYGAYTYPSTQGPLVRGL